MPEKRKEKKRVPLGGKDREMLHERDYEPQSSDSSGSYRYKDHYDGA